MPRGPERPGRRVAAGGRRHRSRSALALPALGGEEEGERLPLGPSGGLSVLKLRCVGCKF